MSDRHRPAPAERRDAIAEAVLARGSGTAAEFAERFGVSLMTIHRDLDELERQGVVRKYRGGVTALRSGVFESGVAYRARSMREEKEAIAAAAVELVEPGMAVMLDDSTTALAVGRRLRDLAPLTIVTNFLDGLNLLSAAEGIKLIALGGDHDPLHNSFMGVSCVEMIESLRADLCFVSASAVSGGDVCHREQRVVGVKRAMLRSAVRSVLLVDHTKLGRTALHRVAPLSAFDRVIVDDGASPAALGDLANRQVEYAVAARSRR
ncbi:DeoR/GlpR family DNA-binding transcription regulator [Actinomadura sp. B10D3]|uniref:DeoR/GlpR family DNA-binding transcription regulator n=1 Tax=Actinomadura sp. B10D3 TaxID=3153557 RepID=UPI00325D5282